MEHSALDVLETRLQVAQADMKPVWAYWEWPKECDGWNTSTQKRYQRMLRQHGYSANDALIYGCRCITYVAPMAPC